MRRTKKKSNDWQTEREKRETEGDEVEGMEGRLKKK